jgi:hypothetical protein
MASKSLSALFDVKTRGDKIEELIRPTKKPHSTLSPSLIHSLTHSHHKLESSSPLISAISLLATRPSYSLTHSLNHLLTHSLFTPGWMLRVLNSGLVHLISSRLDSSHLISAWLISAWLISAHLSSVSSGLNLCPFSNSRKGGQAFTSHPP